MKFTHLPSPELPKLEVIQHADGERYYVTPEGIKYPSITTILKLHPKPGIDKWRKRLGEEKANKEMQRAARRGDILHEMCERYIKNEDPKFVREYDAFARLMFMNIVPELRRINNVLLQETALYTDRMKTAGRVDLVADMDGVLSVIDFKGSTREKKEEWIQHYYMQASTYAFMIYERTKIRIKQIVLIVSCEDGAAQVFKETPDARFIEPVIEYSKQYAELHAK